MRVWALPLAALTVAAGCGGGGDGDGAGEVRPEGTGLLTASFASYDVAVGSPERLLVGLIGAENTLLSYGTVEYRFGFLGTEDNPQEPEYGPPVSARYLPIPGVAGPDPAPTDPQLTPPSEMRGVYAGDTSFDQAGFWRVEVTAEVDGATEVATASFEVGADHLAPAVGEDAPRTENHTVDAGPDVPRVAVDSRFATAGEIPDPELHSESLHDVIAAGRPAVLVISTPVYCQSQFCGPVTDMVADLAADYGDRASFLHFEVWRDFQGLVANKAAAEWIQASNFAEPWVYVVGADGVIDARFGNVATRAEIEPLLQALPVLGPPA